ncbi:thermopsin family protease [Stygiolobus caldivivus]|uniref:Protein kinase domain-containing protein n=1 Tax=Stygiolobus caldivivus TaxID=2824673 RepID=A0A8D5U674_9CREN|nr:thermopsin family protease [Stygiolobus caldivivus]BCU70002.1 hypothetical protein KN1_12990 [Stygiolobus caldivivus]
MNGVLFKRITLIMLAIILLGIAQLMTYSQVTPPSPAVGIVDEGEAPVSGQGIVTYSYTSSNVGGIFTLNSAQTSGPFSLQLNSVIALSNGQYYWSNDVALIKNVGGNTYQITIEDYLWNFSAPYSSINQGLIRGSGGVETYNGIQFYYYSYNTYTVSSPFTLLLETAAIMGYQGYPVVFQYFELLNSNGSEVAGGTFDTIELFVPSSSAYIVVGGTNPTGSGNYLSFVIGGPVYGTELGTTVDIYSWSASMSMAYLSNSGSTFYNVPGGYSTTYEALSGVSTSQGIVESFSGEQVAQTAGQTRSEFLWTVSSFIKAFGNNVYITTIPGGADWVLSVSGPESFSKNLINSTTELSLPDGSYSLSLSLNVQGNTLYSTSYSVSLPYAVEVRVISPVPTYRANGVPENVNTTLSLPVPSVLQFNETYYLSNTERYFLRGVEVNGAFYPNTTIYLTTAGFYTITPQYVLQYYLNVPFQVKAYVNNALMTIGSGWYDAGTTIQVPPQNVSVNGALYEIQGTTFVVDSPDFSLPFEIYYYVSVSQPIPANVNGLNQTISSGYFKEGTTITIYKYYYINSSARYEINANQYQITVRAPVSLTASTQLQYLVTLNLPNGTVTEWITQGSIPTIPSIIQISSNERYALAQSVTEGINAPTTITPQYTTQYLVTVELPNGTTRLWVTQGSTYDLSTTIQINSTTRYLLLSQQEYTINSPQTLTPDYVTQYLVTLNLPNGTVTEWVTQGSIPTVPSIIQISSDERYYLNTTLSPVYGSETITPPYVVQYLVTIGDSQEWVSQGSKIPLNQPNPNPFVNVYWQGNVSAPNGQYIQVSGPISERPVYAINVLSILLLAVPFGAAGIGGYLVYNKRKEVVLSFDIPEGLASTIRVKVNGDEMVLKGRTLRVRRGSQVEVDDVVHENTVLTPVMRNFVAGKSMRVGFQQRTLDLSKFDPGLWVGRRIDSYTVDSVIGEGGTSYVLKVIGADNNVYAMKVMKVVPTPGSTMTMGMRNFQELYKELNNLIELSTKTDAVVKVVGGKVDFPTLMNIMKGNVELYLTSPPYLVMEYMSGGTLSKLMGNPNVRNSSVWEKIVVRVVYDVVRALYFVHSQGYVHLDVKPHNVFFTKYPGDVGDEVYNNLVNGNTQVKLGDLGSAVKVGNPVTQLTLEYCAPEQLVNPAHPSMDIYAVGSMAYALLTGKYFNDVTLVNKAFNELSTPAFQNTYNELLKRVTEKWASLPDDGLMGIIKKMLNPDPAQRPTASEVANMLYSYLTG